MPSSLMTVSINADLTIYNQSGVLIDTNPLTKSLQWTIGDGDVRTTSITKSGGVVTLGTINTLVLVSSDNINVVAGSSTVNNTKIFSYDGVATPIKISTSSSTPVTVDYILSTKAATVPAAPVIIGTTPSASAVTVAFTSPDTGGSLITSYTVNANPGNISKTATSSPIQVTNLVSGTAYTFTVVATNSIGASIASAPSSPVTPKAVSNVPGAPTAVEVSKQSLNSVNVYFRAPTNTGGKPITRYTVTSTPGNITVDGVSSPIVVSGLSVNIPYYFRVTAANANGLGTPSSKTSIILKPDYPSAPTIINVSATGTTAQIGFTPPVNNGGSPINRYTVTSTPGNIVGTGTTSPITVSGLLPRTSYRFTMFAVNIAGASPISNLSNSVTTTNSPPPLTVPGAPAVVEASPASSSSVICYFPVPANTGGSPIIDYTVRSIPGNITSVGAISPITISGLSPNIPYQFVVSARSSVGMSVDSPLSDTITLTSANRVPGAPSITSATQVNDKVRVVFTPPSDIGSAPITSYDVIASADERHPSGTHHVASSSPIDISNLVYGVPYTFTVKATNSVGPSEASAASSSITLIAPETAPSAPRNIEMSKSGTNGVNVYFQVPLSSGNSAITSYTVYSTPDNITATGTQSPILVEPVDPFGTYHFAVYATNANGLSGPRVLSPGTINILI